MDFPTFTISLESQQEFQFIISEILGHHNQKWPRNLYFKPFLPIDQLKKIIELQRFYISITGCIGITAY